MSLENKDNSGPQQKSHKFLFTTKQEKTNLPKKKDVRMKPPQDSSLTTLQQFLVDEAVRKSPFEYRNRRMADAVGIESALLAQKAIGKPDAPFTDMFIKAAYEAGETFSEAFEPTTGNPRSDKKAVYTKAIEQAGSVAFKHLPQALEAANIHVDITRVLRNSDFNDILRLTADELEVALPQTMTPDQIKQSLHQTARGDYFEDHIDTLPFLDKVPLSTDEQHALNLSVRLANVTWKVGQVHRASWEGTDIRIDPQRRVVFNPYDLFKKEQYERFAEESSPQEALIRVAFEVYKDKIQYDPFVTGNPTGI